MHVRGQAALEYLLTYGWALIAIVVVLGAIMVLTAQAATPAICQMNPSSGAITYLDASVVSGSPLKVYLRNDSGKTISDVNLSYSGSFAGVSTSTGNGPYTSAQEFLISSTGFSLPSGSSYSGTIAITYTRNAVTHISTLVCTGSV